MPLLVLVIAYGIYQTIQVLKGNYKTKIILVLLSGLFILNFIFFIDSYFTHFNFQRVRFLHFGYKETVDISNKYPNYNISFRGPDNFPYIYFLFYDKYNPNLFRKEVKYYPPNNEGFTFVKSFGRFNFPWEIDYTKLRDKTIYFDDTDVKHRKIKILLPSGEPILGYEINK